MSVLWTGSGIAAATGGRLTRNFEAKGLSIDSRTVRPGELFIALKDARDGHEFVADALARGAAGAMVSRVPEGVTGPLCVVEDVMSALEALGRAGRARAKARVIAITGSAGKTSTKDMMCHVLARQGRVHGSFASYNNHWGVPLTLALLPPEADFAVIEIGMNHPGEIAPLARMAAPHVAIVTTVAAAHLEAFDSVEAIAREKGSIFQGLAGEGTAILNVDLPVTPILRSAAGGARTIGFGESEGAEFRARRIRKLELVTVVEASTPDGDLLFKVGAPGRHFGMNALAVLAAVDAAGGDPVVAATDLATWTIPRGRGAREVVRLDPGDDRFCVDLIDDAYNANPASVAAGLEVLACSTPRGDPGDAGPGRRIAILGDMLELGSTEDALHAAIAELPQVADITLIHCVGPRMWRLYDALPPNKRGTWCETAEALAARAGSLVAAGDVVLVKGSKGIGVSKVVDAIRKLGHPRAVAG